MDIQLLKDVADHASAVFFLILAVAGVIRKWWVPGWQYREKEIENERWREIALRSLDAAEKGIDQVFRAERRQ